MKILSGLCIAFVVFIQESCGQITPRLPPLTPLPTDFVWCRKGECVNKRKYQNFYKMDDLRAVNASDAFWEMHMGLWATFKIFIILTPNPRPPQTGEGYYEIELTVYNQTFPNAVLKSAIYTKGQYPHSTIIPMKSLTNYDLTSTAFRPFWIKINKGQSLNITVGTFEQTIMAIQDYKNSIDVQYIGFAAGHAKFSEGKIFFDCPHTREGRFLQKGIIENLGRIHTPTCNKCDRCPPVYFPVCATNGKTYRNECYFKCQVEKQYTVLYKGVCFHWEWQV